MTSKATTWYHPFSDNALKRLYPFPPPPPPPPPTSKPTVTVPPSPSLPALPPPLHLPLAKVNNHKKQQQQLNGVRLDSTHRLVLARSKESVDCGYQGNKKPKPRIDCDGRHAGGSPTVLSSRSLPGANQQGPLTLFPPRPPSPLPPSPPPPPHRAPHSEVGFHGGRVGGKAWNG